MAATLLLCLAKDSVRRRTRNRAPNTTAQRRRRNGIEWQIVNWIIVKGFCVTENSMNKARQNKPNNLNFVKFYYVLMEQ